MEAQFIPAAPVGFSADQAYRGVEDQQSMMMRASQLRQQQQMEQLRQQQIAENTVLAPLREAQAKAQIISAGSSITNHTEMENLKAQAAAASVGANNEFNEALKLADWNSQSDELSRLQAKYAWMGNVRDDKNNQLYGGFLKAVDEARANAIIRAKTDQQLEADQLKAETMAQVRPVIAQIGADSRVQSAQIAAGSRENVAATTTAARKDIATATHDASMDRTEVRGYQQAAIQADREALKFAENGDDEKAAEARRTAENFRTQAKAKATKPAADTFSVPNVTDKGASSTGVTADGQPKLYTPPSDGQPPAFTPAVKTPGDVLSAMQQMVNDGVITADQARETLTKLGFKKKGG